MAKQSGLGDNFYLDEFNVSGDIASLESIRSPFALLPQTGIDKSAHERTHGLRDGGITLKSWFNTATGQQHPVMKTLTRSDRQLSYFRGATIGNPAACLIGKQVDYPGTREEDGGLHFGLDAQANAYGLEWGEQLTAGVRTDTSATNGSSLDYGAAVGTTAFGLQMYVHLFSFTGTSVTITVESSTDNGAGDAFATVTGATTGALSAAGKTRVATATNVNVERYLRVATTGTFSSAVFAVAVIRNLAVPVF